MNKIAVVTQEGLKISSHFGMAPFYHVYTIEDGEIIATEQREKPHHKNHRIHHEHAGPIHMHEHGDEHHEQHQGSGHGHGAMFAPIKDCDTLICGGMGQPAYQGALAAGLQVVLTGGEIRPIVEAYLAGEINSDPRRVHQH